MAEVKLNNAGVAGNEFSTRKYVDAAGLQALIDKIGALRTSLKADDAATAAAATEALNNAVESINRSITSNAEADAARAERIEALETWKGTTDTALTNLGNADTALGNRIKAIEDDYVTGTSYATDKAALEKADSDEATARSNADTALGNRIKAIEDKNLGNASDYVLNSTYTTKMSEIDGKLADILEALNNAVVAADVNAAFESATTDAPQA